MGQVAKTGLDITLRPAGSTGPRLWTTPNEAVGITELATRLKGLRPALVVLEATGGLEIPVAAALAAADVPLAVVNPRRVRDFAKGVGDMITSAEKKRGAWAILVVRPGALGDGLRALLSALSPIAEVVLGHDTTITWWTPRNRDPLSSSATPASLVMDYRNSCVKFARPGRPPAWSCSPNRFSGRPRSKLRARMPSSSKALRQPSSSQASTAC